MKVPFTKLEIVSPEKDAVIGRQVKFVAQVEDLAEGFHVWVLVYASGERAWYPTRLDGQSSIRKETITVGSVDCDGAAFILALYVTDAAGNSYLESTSHPVRKLPEGSRVDISVRRKNRISRTTVYDHRYISVHDSTNVFVGDGNQQHFRESVEEIVKAINASESDPAEKDEARSRLKAFLEHPLVCGLAGGLLGLLD
jgi:hypothetical protein